MIVLGIETSCDETAVAIIKYKNSQKKVLANVINSQISLHQIYGGVVPELASRSHLEILDKLILEAKNIAKISFEEIDAFAGTSGPGLIGAVIVGMMTAKTLASLYRKPFIAVNHLEGHSLTARFSHNIEFPYLLLLLSGGHCQILLAKGVGNYLKIGETIDDALGEAFDKVAQMLGMGYPGGPAIEQMAKEGNRNNFKLPKPLIDNNHNDKSNLYNFSFSGLKTAVRRLIEKVNGEPFHHLTSPSKISLENKKDISASFQFTVAEIIANRLENVLNKAEIKALVENNQLQNVVIAGGVAANQFLFNYLQKSVENHGLKLISPPINLCTDNAVMIAWAGIENLLLGKVNDLDFKARSNWPLDDFS